MELSNSDNLNSQFRVNKVEYIEFWVGNAKLCSKFYSHSFGFSPLAIKGLQTGEKGRTSHVISQNNAVFIFTSTLNRDDEEFNNHLTSHGDAIKDVALQVNDVYGIYHQAISNGAQGLEAPHEIRDENGSVVIAKIAAPFGDTVHTLIDRSKYTGSFLPGYKTIDSASRSTPSSETEVSSKTGITNIDHIALAYEQGKISEALSWYIKCLGFHHFLCNDEDTDTGLTIEGMESGLKTTVAASCDEEYALKFVFVEAHNTIKVDQSTGLQSEKKNQISEFIEYNGGKAGVHHIALHTKNIIDTVSSLRNGGVDFITVPQSYYDELFASATINLKDSPSNDVNNHHIHEDPKKLQELGILLDISHKSNAKLKPNFILQTFTVPLQDRPTFFFEIISRKGSRGFGERTIKALFEAVERLQQQRTVTASAITTEAV